MSVAFVEQTRLERTIANTRWTPIRFVERRGDRHPKYFWLMRCRCGVEKIINIGTYRNGTSMSCGCYNREITTARPGAGKKPDGESARNHLFLVYRKGAAKRGFEFELTKERVAVLTSSQCHYCGRSPTRILDRSRYGANGTYRYNGIDRKDHMVGYVEENVVPCCRECNYAKGTLSYGEFMAWIRTLMAFHSVSKETPQ